MAPIALPRTRASRAVLFVLLAGCAPGDRGDDDDDFDGGSPDADIPGVDAAPQGPCQSDSDCDDGIVCTIDHCAEDACTHSPCTDCCDEGLRCIEGYGCGTAPEPCTTDEECGDDTRCTLDRCRDATECEHVPQEALCSSGEVCLAALGCIPEPLSECTRDGDCFGDRPCLGTWRCVDEFGCQFVSILDCDDDDPCTADECRDDQGGCVHSAPEELCNGTDDDCDDEVDEDFECMEGETAACVTACGSAGTRVCGPDCTLGDCVTPEEVCNHEDDDCDDDVDEGFQCSSGASEECATICGSTGSRACLDDCTWDDCSPPAELCNGADDDCDGACDDGFDCCAREARDCTLFAFDRGSAVCEDDCAGWDTSACSRCGDGNIDATEECDGENLGDDDCTTIPGDFTAGDLACGADCRFDTGGCDRWDPSGNYQTEPDIAYSCADVGFGPFVDYSFDSCQFAAAGGVLNVTCDDVPCPMSGFIDDQRNLDVSCLLSGTCDETYALSGSFIDDDTWEGTFTATFSGDCLDCVDQSDDVTGSR